MAHQITISQLPSRQIQRFNAAIVPFRVNCQPDLNEIHDLGDYLQLINGILDSILEAMENINAQPNDMISIMIITQSFHIPVSTAWVRMYQFSKQLVFEVIEKVFQSNKKFIFDEEFFVYGRIVREPKIGSRKTDVMNLAEARLHKMYDNKYFMI